MHFPRYFAPSFPSTGSSFPRLRGIRLPWVDRRGILATNETAVQRLMIAADWGMKYWSGLSCQHSKRNGIVFAVSPKTSGLRKFSYVKPLRHSAYCTCRTCTVCCGHTCTVCCGRTECYISPTKCLCIHFERLSHYTPLFREIALAVWSSQSRRSRFSAMWNWLFISHFYTYFRLQRIII